MSFVNPSAPPVIIHTGGITMTTRCRSIPPPPGSGNITGDGNGTAGGGGASTVTGGAKDLYGTTKIFPDSNTPPCQPFYLDMYTKSSNSTRFNVSYGTGSHLDYTLDTTSSNYNFYNTAGSAVTYAGGNGTGRSIRLDIYPAGGIWTNNSTYSYKNNPGYLYTSNSLQSHELTAYIRPHTRLNTHETFSFRIQGRDEDAIRSCIEMVYPTLSNSNVLVNVNYVSNIYIAYGRTKQYEANSSTNTLTPDNWIGVKVVYIVADDSKSVWLGLYEDIDPIDEVTGEPKNRWKLRADCIFTGVSEEGYENIIPSWKTHKDQIRIDGFDNVDFMYISDREIEKGALKNPSFLRPSATTIWQYGSIPQFQPDLFDGVGVGSA